MCHEKEKKKRFFHDRIIIEEKEDKGFNPSSLTLVRGVRSTRRRHRNSVTTTSGCLVTQLLRIHSNHRIN